MPPQELQAPWSSGTRPPRTVIPVQTVDCHMHVFEDRFPVDPNARNYSIEATVAQYRMLQRRLGMSRNVVVQPSTYGVDNTGLIEVMAQFGTDKARGVAVVNAGASDMQLHELDRAGVRGLRFNLRQSGGATTMDMLEPLSRRIAPLGWHIQLQAPADVILRERTRLSAIPCPLVLDHYANVLLPSGGLHPAFAVVRELMQAGKAWVKLSAPYLDSQTGAPAYTDVARVARAYLAEAPERIVWATNWPHATEDEKPDDAAMLDLFSEWVASDSSLTRILVDNPAQLYGFSD